MQFGVFLRRTRRCWLTGVAKTCVEAIFRVAVRTVRRFVYVALAQSGNSGLINACNYLAVVGRVLAVILLLCGPFGVL